MGFRAQGAGIAVAQIGEFGLEGLEFSGLAPSQAGMFPYTNSP